MRSKNIFIYLAFSIVLLSCGKGIIGPARVQGLVSDATTLDPIYNAKVYLLEAKNAFDPFGPPPSWYVIDSATTGAFGKFSIQYDERDGYRYSVDAFKEHYLVAINPESILSLGSGIDVEVQLFPEAFLKVHIHNVNTYDPWDYIGINGLENGPYYGNEVDTIELKQVRGNETTTLYSFLYDDGENAGSVEHAVYCPAFDTTYFEILY
ncbi:MAG: hypothetical protein R2794_06055 [Chitinophagales bacterium]